MVIKIGITGRIGRIVDNEHRVFAEAVPKGAGIIKQVEGVADQFEFGLKPLKIDPPILIQFNIDIKRIDVEPVRREQIAVLPGGFLHEIDERVRLAAFPEEKVADNHLHVVGYRSFVESSQLTEEILDDFLISGIFLVEPVLDTQVDQEIPEPAPVIGLIFHFGEKCLVFFKEQVDAEIFVKMIVQCSLVSIRDNIQDHFAPVHDFFAYRLKFSLQQIFAIGSYLSAAAAFNDGGDAEIFISRIEIIAGPFLKFGDQLAVQFFLCCRFPHLLYQNQVLMQFG